PPRNRVFKVDPVGRHGHQRFSTKTGGCDKGSFIHPGQCLTTKQSVMMVGSKREHRLTDTGFRSLDTALDFSFSFIHKHGSKLARCEEGHNYILLRAAEPGLERR